MRTIFVVDDNDTNLSTAETALEDNYDVVTIPSAAKMFSLLEKITPNLILLDIEMPEINGFEALYKLKTGKWADIPVIFLTANTDPTVEVHGFKMGVIDFIKKPFSAPVLLNRINKHLEINKKILERMTQLQQLQNSIISVLADMIEKRDKATGKHIERTSIFIRLLIEEIKLSGVYADEVKGWDIEKTILSARMHDLGKISITDEIINKPDKLTEEEYNTMKTHAICGEQIIEEIIARTGEGDFLINAKLFAGSHHERWDGSGYPRGLKGADIPLQGRIMAIADVYDALVSERPYKKAYTHKEAVKTIMDDAGTHYDPLLAEAFFRIQGHFEEVNKF